jgi:flagellar hook-associated protein 1 FlgK
MSLAQALATAVSGLRATQAGISLVSANVANAETPGYVRKTATQIETAAGDLGISVRVDSVNRILDQYVQRQLRVETSGASYADLRAQFYDQLQTVYGVPGSQSAFETVYNNFTTALQGLSTSPDSVSARSNVLAAAQVLTQQLNSMTTSVQGLRSNAELGLADSVTRANDAMTRIAQINQQLGTTNGTDSVTASLLDQRDAYIDQLSQLMDISVVQNDHNQITVFTASGLQLVGTGAAKLAFDAQGLMTAAAHWDADPTKRTVGTIVLTGANGGTIDLVADKAIRSGKIAAYLEMRDQVLVQAQAQLDEIAAGMARALSEKKTDGVPVSASPTQSGFDIDLSNLQNGNSIRVTYTDNATSKQKTVTLIRVDDTSALPLSNSATADPNDRVVGLDFSGGLASVVGQLTTALAGTGLVFSNTSPTTLRVLDDGAPNKINVDAASATTTVTSLTGGSAELPFFLDANSPYTGAITSVGPQSLGFAGRITVNAGLVADPSRLVVFQTSPLTAAGDSTRPNFIYDRLTSASLIFSPSSGVGTVAAPFNGTVSGFIRQMINQQGQAADAAANLKEGQDVVLNTLQKRFDEGASVNIDEEMANLLHLQNSYAANARVLSAVKDMVETLLRTIG